MYFLKYKQPLVRLLRVGDSTAWKSRKITANRILHGNPRVLAMWPVLAYVVDSVKV